MLPSKKRLSRSSFTLFLASKDLKTVFNNLGTLKYKKSLINKASVVISSKHEKRAVYRNKLRRRLYVLFSDYFKGASDQNQYILYVSKQAPILSFQDIKTLFYELLKKTTK
jgi:ribonuclease P protein component